MLEGWPKTTKPKHSRLISIEAPSGEISPPPIETRGQLLPVEGLRWDDFEKLCLRVARLEGDPRRSRRYGVPGQAQGGIDLYSALSEGGYATYQCKKYDELTALIVVGGDRLPGRPPSAALPGAISAL